MDVSGSSSSAAAIYDYDVYLTYSADLVKGDALYKKLQDAKLRVLRYDERLSRKEGSSVNTDHLQKIERCRISILIFSDSPLDFGWERRCLDEVVRMVECRGRQAGQMMIFPMYNGLNPNRARDSILRRIREHFGKGTDPERVEKWKRALGEVISLKGWEQEGRSWFQENHIDTIVSYVVHKSSLTVMDEPKSSSSAPTPAPTPAPGAYRHDVVLTLLSDKEGDLRTTDEKGGGFLSGLYRSLKDAGLLVFSYEDIPVGEKLAPFILQAIKGSRISIPVFSTSSYSPVDGTDEEAFLDELLQMVECRKSKRQMIFPIYYTISSRSIRYRADYSGRINPDTIERYKQALRDVTSLKGWELDDDSRSMHKSIKSITSYVGEKLPTITGVSKSLSSIAGISNHDVVLTFGPNIATEFSDFLYEILKDAGVPIFPPELIPVGEETGPFMLEAIKRSRISIPVFSRPPPCYSQKRLPSYSPADGTDKAFLDVTVEAFLDELVQMVECRNSKRQMIFPIYHGIGSRSVRYRADYSGRINPDTIERRNQALREVTSLKGWELETRYYRASRSLQKPIESIISYVWEKLSPSPDVSKSLSSIAGISNHDVVLTFDPDIETEFAHLLYNRLKDAGVPIFSPELIPVGEEMGPFMLEAIKRSKISIPVFSNPPPYSPVDGTDEAFLDDLVQMVECRESKRQMIFPIYFGSKTSRISFDVVYGYDVGRINPDVIEKSKQAVRELTSLKGWKLDRYDSRSCDEPTIKSIASYVHRRLSSRIDVQKSSFSVAGIYGYNLLLSFSPRTSKDFTDHLYHGLKDAGFVVLIDGEIPVGEKMGSSIDEAIHRFIISLPVFDFSKDDEFHGPSHDELARMLECSGRQGHIFLPIYFGVDPSKGRDKIVSLRRRYGPRFEQKMASIEEGCVYCSKPKKLSTPEEKEAHYRSFVNTVLDELKEKRRTVLGAQVQAEKLKEALQIVESQEVLFVGIHGLGGIGKTTLAKAVFNQLSPHFEACSFLTDIRETSRRKGLKYLQDKLLRDITGADTESKNNTARHIFLEKKVLIVLDDVDEKRQIEELIGRSNRFVSGSSIIITTRDINVLSLEPVVLHGGRLKWPKEVKMEEMNCDKALQLFSIHAFGKIHPPDDYLITICEQVVNAVGGLPLALEVIGSFLCHKHEDMWKDTLEKLQSIPDRELHAQLMISFKDLGKNTKEVFLDIACYFNGVEKTTPIYMWDACGLDPEQGIKDLIFMSLIKISDDNKLWMHDEVRDFGRKIVREGANDLTLGTRFWINQEVLDILESKNGNENVLCLRLPYDDFQWDCDFPSEGLGSLPNLRFLEFLGFPIRVELALPTLRWLSWHFCPQDVKGTDLCLEKLVILDLSNSGIQNEFWESAQLKEAKNLKVLNLTSCKGITKTPSFSECMILERLILEDCENLVEIDRTIGKLENLMYLNLSGCHSLRELPKELGLVESLKELIVKRNGQSFKLHKSTFSRTSLSVLEVCNAEIFYSLHIENSEMLERLTLSKCLGMKEFPGPAEFFRSLVKLDLSGSDITHLTENIGEMRELKVINIESSLIRKLPASIGKLKKLEELHAKNCTDLHEEIPSEIGDCSSLMILDLSSTKISSLPSTLTKLGKLQTLYLESCHELRVLPNLPMLLGRLHLTSKEIRYIPDLSEMYLLSDLQLSCAIDELPRDLMRRLSRLEKLELWIPRLTSLEFDVESLLRSLSLSCRGLKTLAQLPSTLSRLCLAHLEVNMKFTSLRYLKRLTFLEFISCTLGGDGLESLGIKESESLEHLSSIDCNFSSVSGPWLPKRLRLLYVEECQYLDDVLDLSELKDLVHLELMNCKMLTGLRGLGELESLEEINIYNCNSLETLGDLSNLQKLEALSIESCEKFREVEGLGGIQSLKRLEISGCKSLESSARGSKPKKRKP